MMMKSLMVMVGGFHYFCYGLLCVLTIISLERSLLVFLLLIWSLLDLFWPQQKVTKFNKFGWVSKVKQI